uniref:Uncharacterized protein n=1 Tax=Arundo donax TaxID=35708 RepID=A0A0A9H1Y1_ARUDO
MGPKKMSFLDPVDPPVFAAAVAAAAAAGTAAAAATPLPPVPAAEPFCPFGSTSNGAMPTSRPFSTAAAERGALDFFRQRKKSRASRSSTPNTQPMAMPAMAPPESFFFLPPPMSAAPPAPGWDSGDPAGVSAVSPGQRPSGPPQRPVLPKNESLGILRSLVGMDPLSLLYDTLNCSNAGKSSLGISPERSLFSRCSVPSRISLLKSGEISPENLFPARSILTRFLSANSDAGSSPEKLLCWK